MNKKEFLSALEAALSDLSRQDKQKTLDFYREMIDDRLEDGLTEEAAIASIGAPWEIAMEARSELPKKRRCGKIWLVFLLILGSPVWLPILLSVAAVVVSVLISIFAVELTLAVSGVACILGGLVMLLYIKPWNALFFLGIGLVAAGLAIPLFYLCVLSTKGLWRLTKNLFSPIFRKE